MPERCVMCGVIIPEGYQVCPNCTRKVNALWNATRLYLRMREVRIWT